MTTSALKKHRVGRTDVVIGPYKSEIEKEKAVTWRDRFSYQISKISRSASSTLRSSFLFIIS